MVRLELASSGDFPRGSAGRAYLVRVPLNDDGQINGAVLETEPGRATVRRYWANEADRIGYLVQTPSGIAIRYETDEPDDDRTFPIAASSIQLGAQVRLTDLDGRELPFKVASLT